MPKDGIDGRNGALEGTTIAPLRARAIFGRNHRRASPYKRCMAFRPKSNLHALPRETADSGERWRIIWDTKRRGAGDGRNTALEKFEGDALDRARHLLRMGFVVYE